MSDLELMSLAKKHVSQRKIFKWHMGTYVTASIFLAAVFVIGGENFWLVWIILGWGLLVTFHGVGISIMLSGSRPSVTDEYNRLKGYAMIAEKMNGGDLNE